MKTLFMETVSLTRYLRGDDKIEESQLTVHNLKFQIEGNTCLHLFALDTEALAIILEFLEENRKDYLNGILMRNFAGFTPLDMTIDKDSPKNTDMLLISLSKLDEANYSDQMYKKFSQLLQMELRSFHSYLASCRFQTVQMQNSRYLSLKEDKEVLIVAHHCCILDRNFIEKYTTIGNANKEIREKQLEILEKEHRFAEQQHREAEAEKKRREAARKKKEQKMRKRTKRSSKGGYYSKSLRAIKTDEIFLEDRSATGENNYSLYSEDSEYYSSNSDNSSLPSYMDESPTRRHPHGNLDFQQVQKLQAQKEKANKKKQEKKMQKQKIYEERRKAREEKEKEQQELILSDKKKLAEEREKQREAHKRGLKKYEVTAIEFDWLFNEEHGRDFLVHLTRTDSIEIFSIDLINKIVLFLWIFYRRAIFFKILVPFLIYFVVFLAYATWIHYEKVQEGEDEGIFFTLNVIMIAIIIFFIVYNVYFEIRKLLFYQTEYFLSFWNYINVFSIVMNFFVVLSDLGYMDNDVVAPFLALAVLFMWIKLIYFGRMFFSTAWMVRMINSVTKDMRYFLIIFAISVVAFANAYEILSRNGSPRVSGANFWDAIVYSYQNGLGEFDLDNFESNRDEALFYILWVLSTFLILIVFLNLLIAIISDIFDKVHENINNNLMKELVYFMVESEVLINRKALFKKQKYIIIVARERGETGEFDAESKLSVIRHNMDRQVTNQKKELDRIRKGLERDIKEKIQMRSDTLESSASKQIAQLSDRIEETETLHNKYKVLFETLLRIESD